MTHERLETQVRSHTIILEAILKRMPASELEDIWNSIAAQHAPTLAVWRQRPQIEDAISMAHGFVSSVRESK